MDLVESGETMRAAHLHDIDTLLSSESVLIANPRSQHPQLIRTILNRIQGVITANRHLLVKYNIERSKLKEATKITPGNRAPTLSPLDQDNWVAVEAMISKKDVALTLDQLEQCGATDIIVFRIDNCRA